MPFTESFDDLATNVAMASSWWEDVTIDVTDTYHHSSNTKLVNANFFETVDINYSETSTGQKHTIFQAKLSNGQISLQEYYFDGSKAASLVYLDENPVLGKPDRISISRVFAMEDALGASSKPGFLKYLELEMNPLHEMLSESKFQGITNHKDLKVSKFLFEAIDWGSSSQNILYYIDHNSGLPVKVESYVDGVPPNGVMLWSWEATDMGMSEEHSYPSRTTFTSYNTLNNKTKYVINSKINVKYNSGLEGKSFWPAVTPGMRVEDTIANTSYIVPGSIPQSSNPATEVATVEHSARPPLDLVPAVSIAAITLGIVCFMYFIFKRVNNPRN